MTHRLASSIPHVRDSGPRSSPRQARGFTLIEIMVVVIIIGLLAAVIVPQVISKVDDARVAKAKEDIQSLETALTEYRLDNSTYPTTEEGLKALVKQPNDPSVTHWHGPYVQRLSKDPWGQPYQYVYPGTHGLPYDLYTLGADGQPGGNGINADIGNWNLTE
ncbi:MAG: type II secretion system major pseudopilin GspG [Proteobacteria bacterium]|nr:type II secretion system major pseudopilin GspG [Pseudomonadota bacterium]